MKNPFIKNFLKGSIATSMGSVSSILFQFISIMIITRHISKEEFGLYVLAVVIVSIFNLLSGLGLEIGIVKFISSSSNHEEKESYIIPVLVMRFLLLICMSAVFYLIGHLIVPLFDS